MSKTTEEAKAERRARWEQATKHLNQLKKRADDRRDMSKTTEEEEKPPEPYMPYRFRKVRGFDGDDYWGFSYHNYTKQLLCSAFVGGKDELDAYIQAIKYLNRLKKRADDRRDKKKEQTS